MPRSADVPPTRGEVDPGLANERTSLAWNRTALSLGAIGGLGIKAGIEGEAPYVAYPLGGIVLAAAGAVFLYGLRTYRSNRVQLQGGAVLPHPGVLRAMAIGTAVVGLIAFALALLSS